MNLNQNDNYNHGCIYDISVFENCLIFTGSDIIDKNIFKKFVLHEDLFQLKGLVKYIRDCEFLISSQSYYYDSKILEFIDLNFDNFINISVKNVIDDIINFSKSLKECDFVFNEKYLEIEDIISVVNIRSKDSSRNIDNFYPGIKKIKSSFQDINLDYSRLEGAMVFNFNKVLTINLLYHNLFKYNDLVSYCNKRGIKVKSIKKEKEQLSLF